MRSGTVVVVVVSTLLLAACSAPSPSRSPGRPASPSASASPSVSDSPSARAGDGTALLGLPAACRGDGAAVVLRGTDSGVAAGDVLPGPTGLRGGFGSVVAHGDVTGDGVPDALVLAPDEVVDGPEETGRMRLLVGGAGLSIDRAQVVDATTFGLPGPRPAGASRTLDSPALGDFNADGHDDLAVVETVTSPFTEDDLPPDRARRRVLVVPGSADGLVLRRVHPVPDERLPQIMRDDDLFAGAVELVASDGPGADSLAFVVQPYDDVAQVGVLHGGEDGLGSGAPHDLLIASALDLGGVTAAAFGDFDGDGAQDLALVDGGPDVVVVTDLVADGDPESMRVRAGVEGELVRAGDLDGDGRGDLAVQDGARSVRLLPGSPGGLDAERTVSITASGGERAVRVLPGSRGLLLADPAGDRATLVRDVGFDGDAPTALRVSGLPAGCD